MAEAVPGSNGQSLNNFLSHSPWDHRPVMDHVAREADRHLGGDPDSCLLIDETSFPKKGNKSVGVARQWCGRLGKVDNCQVAVFAVLCCRERHTPIDTRMYLPKGWIEDPDRCRAAAVPDDAIGMRTKADHALAMVRHARANGIRFAWSGYDAGYGKDPQLLRALDADGEIFVADVHKSQTIYLEDPRPHYPEGRKGRPAKYLKAQGAAVRVDKWVKQQPEEAWRRVTVRDTTRGSLNVDILHQRIWLWDGQEAKPHCWHLIVRREVDSPKTIKYSLSNAPADTTIERLAFMQGQRFWVERSFEDAKSACGMAEYQVRLWTGWHHHMAMVMIAMLFMLEERLLQQEEVPLLSCGDIVALLKHFLPKSAVTTDDILKQMRIRHEARQRSIDCARLKDQRLLE